VKRHDPQRALEMPQGPRPQGGGTTPAPATPAVPDGPARPGIPPAPTPQPGGANPPVNVNPAVRNIEKIER
jgi:hypothetical protein